jgi:hypothetical protein
MSIRRLEQPWAPAFFKAPDVLDVLARTYERLKEGAAARPGSLYSSLQGDAELDEGAHM